MAEIRLAGNLIEALSLLGYGHLQVVFVDGATQLENEVQAPASVLLGSWTYPAIRDHTDTANTSNFDVPGEYAATMITLGDGRSAEGVWSLLEQIRAEFVVHGAGIDYDTDKNSNSYVTTILAAVGIDVNDHLVGATPTTVSSFPGVGVNVLEIAEDAFGLDITGGDDDDILMLGLGDDMFTGMAGDDNFDGGGGIDTARFSGDCSEYDISKADDGTVTIAHVRGSMADGTDTLTDVEFAEFADYKLDLTVDKPSCIGQDIAFVIDTTGSMFDDIDAVKARAGEIINTIFDAERGQPNSRIAVVGYNDPDTETILSFTNQADIEDRKAAALSAINGISVGGGGDFPEAVFAGLLRALDGSAGDWREEASARRIILFGDAPPKDEELAGRVFELAADLSVTLGGEVATDALADGLTRTTFDVTVDDASGAEIAPVPVEIFTIQIGADASTAAAFTDIATMTGGKTFTAADATEIVDALIEAIDTPTNSAPTDITLSDSTVDENVADGTVVGIVNVTDPDADDTHTVSLLDDAGGLFILEGNDLKVATGANLDFEAGATHEVTVEATDSGALTFQKTLTITLNDIMESFNGGGKDDVIVGDAGGNIIDAGGGNDIVFALGGDDTANGGAGDDDLRGGDGEDMLIGGAGNDFMDGGDHSDILDGGMDSEDDWASYSAPPPPPGPGGGSSGGPLLSADMGSAGAEGVYVDLGSVMEGAAPGDMTYGTAVDQFGWIDDLISVENIEGSSRNDALIGSMADNVLLGLQGDDYLDGDGGNDALFGDEGDDYIRLGKGSDYAVGGSGHDAFVFSRDDVVGGEVDMIDDFNAAQDFFLLTDGLSVSDLVFFDNGDGASMAAYDTASESWWGVYIADADAATLRHSVYDTLM